MAPYDGGRPVGPMGLYGAAGGYRTPQELEAENARLREALQQLEHHVRQLQTGPLSYAVVVKTLPAERRAVLAWGGNLMEVAAPAGATLRAGDVVRASMDKFEIVDVAQGFPRVGGIRQVRGLHRDLVEVEDGMGSRLANPGRFAGQIQLGDRVILDGAGTTVLERIQGERSAYSFDGKTGISWDDIAGLEEAKRDLREAIELPLAHGALFAAYGRRPVKGVLLYGPPGGGKTLLGKAVATAVATVRGASGSETGFLYVKGPELLNSFVGQSEANVRGLFASARKHRKTHGYPCVIFIDEADALVRRRGGLSMVRGMESTIVPQFLAEMDGLEESAAIVILSTNRPDELDSAVVREGRIDRKIRVPRPDRALANAIARLHLRRATLSQGLDVEAAADGLVEALFAGLPLWEVDVEGMVGVTTETFALHDVASGAMVAGIVEAATSAALHRDLSAGRKHPSGVGLGDISEAVASTHRHNADLDHREDLDAWAHERGFGKIRAIRKARRTA